MLYLAQSQLVLPQYLHQAGGMYLSVEIDLCSLSILVMFLTCYWHIITLCTYPNSSHPTGQQHDMVRWQDKARFLLQHEWWWQVRLHRGLYPDDLPPPPLHQRPPDRHLLLQERPRKPNLPLKLWCRTGRWPRQQIQLQDTWRWLLSKSFILFLCGVFTKNTRAESCLVFTKLEQEISKSTYGQVDNDKLILRNGKEYFITSM